jgi:hypothetical protein
MSVLTRLLGHLAACYGMQASASGLSTFDPGTRGAFAAGAAASAPAVHGIAQLLGTASYQLVASITCGLPWVLRHGHEPEHSGQVRIPTVVLYIMIA